MSEIVLIDSDTEPEAEFPSKRLRLGGSTDITTPAVLPPMHKPFMDDSDEITGDTSVNGSSDQSVEYDIDNNSSAVTITNIGTVCKMEKQPGAFVTNTTAFGEHQNSARSLDTSEMCSQSDFDSSDLEELPTDLLSRGVNGQIDAESKARSRGVYEMRKFVKKKGPMAFLKEYLPEDITTNSVIDLILKLGYVPRNLPPADNPDTYLKLLHLLWQAMNRVRELRPRLENFYQVSHVLEALRKARKVLIITGAGISTSLGIPDFRSSDGFYSKLDEYNLDDPQDVFNLSVFKENPQIFYSIAHMILPPENVKAPLHMFLRLLQDKGKLLRNYTQNIDNLEINAGILPDKMVQCHGSIRSASCVTCKHRVKGTELYPDIKQQKIHYCKKCTRQRHKYMNSDVEVSESFGVMKPDITFFGEDLPEEYYKKHKSDLAECDLLISIGTSLRVAPVSNMVDIVPPSVPQILINRDPIPSCNFDVSFLGFCDDVVSYLCDQLGRDWAIDHPQYPELVGKYHDNLEANETKEKGVYNIENKRREDATSGTVTKAAEPNVVVLEPTLS